MDTKKDLKSSIEKDVFSKIDHAIVRAAVKRLPGLLSAIVELRFWERYTIAEIAEELGVTMNSVEKAMENSFRLLREECLRHPAFSRSLYAVIKDSQLKLAA